MSQISLSSLLSKVGVASDGGTKLRPSATHADATARQDFASLIAGRMQSGSSGSTPVDGAANAPKASTSVPISTPENAASAFAQVFSQVSASHGHAATTTESTNSASGNGDGSAPLLRLVAQMRALLARIHPDASKAGAGAGSNAQQGADQVAAGNASVEGLSLSEAIRALKDLFVKAGITPSAVADAKSATAKLSSAQAKSDGAADGQAVETGLASLLSLMQSLQTALKNQAKKLAQEPQVTTEAGAAQLAALQQLQQQLQEWGKQVVQMQQNGSVGRGDLKAMLAQLQAALSTKEGDARPSTTTAAGDRAVTAAGTHAQAGQPAIQKADEAAKAPSDGRQPDWMAAIRQQHAQLRNRSGQHTNADGQASRDAGTANSQSGSTASASLSTAALSAAARPAQGAATAASQGFLGAAVDPAASRDSSAQGATSVNSAALGGASLSGVASAMTALTGSHTPAGIFGTGGAQPQVNPQLAPGVGQQIQWMVGKSVSSASINVTPADLGPLKIHVQMQQDGGLQVQLMAHQHMTRDMLEQSLPRLRDWLQEAGLGQANVSVGPDTSGDTGAQLAQQQGQGSGNSSGAFGSGAGVSGVTDSGHEPRVIQGPVTLLDLFA